MIVGRVGHRERADTVLTVIGGGERYLNMQEMSVLPRHYEPMTPPHGYLPQLNYASVEGGYGRRTAVEKQLSDRLKLSPAPLAAVEDDDKSRISYSQIDMLRTQALREDRDDEGTRALIEKHDAIKDPRWCVRHFADPSDSLPIDKRIVPTRSVTIPTVPLRTIRPADLVPPSQFHIEPLQLNNFESRRDDIIADSYHIPKSPTILGSKRDQPWLSLLALEEEYSWNDIDIDYALSKKFKKEVSTKTTTTIATEGTEYRYSQDSQLEEEDIEIEGEEMENESSTEMGKYAIVEDSSLKRLFKRCEECGASLDTSAITIRRCGSARIVSYHCINEECNAFVTWESQEKVGQGRGKVYSANHKIPVAAFVTGMPFPRFIDFGKLLDIDLPCDSSLRRNMREYGGVAIERVFEGWQEAAREIAVNASEGKGLQVSIDGQYDSPGYTASNCKVTIIDCETKLALAGIALHKDEDGIDGISCRMESEGALRGLVELIEDGIEIRTRVGDQNGMVNKKLREHPLTANIENLHDWWHVQRPLRKEWWQIVKDNRELTPIYQQFFNHLYFVHNKYPNKDDRPRALELVQSFIMHAQGKHKWVKDANFQIVTKCEHGRLRRKKGDKRPTLKANSPELELIRELLFKPKFTKAFLSAASLIDTAINECYHSLSLMYAAKRFACSPRRGQPLVGPTNRRCKGLRENQIRRVGHRERADTVLTVIGGGERYLNMQEMSVLPRHYEPMTPPHGYLPQLNYASVEGGYGRRTAVQVGQIRKRRDDQ
ncbi:hypothetical protein PRIPAC_74592 [Pristionchus pacificus]|uniref:Mutator-like transposase domain-containing protein n=1 Tax=Pristionchus pacificus TaxID=54126 RepID=A0A2A6CFR1_PRIPA|nr:hypothetical protein PRIPAC_74592 [Pristionchus pacificus]|eukprot:PDM77075.1 hypothetical protein PRIPAC_42470 [Pristionchus pacificus]